MSTKADYVFTRDFLDNNSINLMHHFWTKNFDYLLHPKIPTDAANLRVADVGTGTGTAAVDPPCQCDSQAVGRQAASSEELVGVFGIVHVRFFSFVLVKDEVLPFVEKLFRLLKPSGYLQWRGPDLIKIRVDKSDPNNKTEKLEQLFKLTTNQDPRLKPNWIKELPSIFASAGFVDVEKEIANAPPHEAFMAHECGLMIHELVARKTKGVEAAKELEELLSLVVEESRQGAWVDAEKMTFVGKKPA